MKITRVHLLVSGLLLVATLVVILLLRPPAIIRIPLEQHAEAERARAEVEALLPKLPQGNTHLLDLPYVEGTRASGKPDSIQTLDLFVPPGPGPFPLVIWIHGGGWHSGGKESSGAQMATAFLLKGFALASLNYRLVADAPFPAQVEDCNAALAWLRQRATKYHLDPNRIGVAGHSAGAHLAALMAVTGDSPRYARNAPGDLRVQAAVCWAIPADLDVVRGQWPKNSFLVGPQSLARFFFPKAVYDADFAREASPSSYIHAGLPPILIVHGAKDDIVPVGQARAFAEGLKNAGNEVVFRVDPTHDHNVMTALSIREALAFFQETLMPPPAEASSESAR